MKQISILLGALVLFHFSSEAQTRHIVRFRDKGATTFTIANPSAYLSARAIERRTRYGIAIDSTDLPVPADYISQVQSITGVTVLNTSRWLNAITVVISDGNAISNINALPFVKNVAAIAGRETRAKRRYPEDTYPVTRAGRQKKHQEADFFDYGANSFNEIHLHNGEFLHNIGLRGQGMQMAFLDGGFFNYTGLKAFDSVNLNGQVLSTWDFVSRNTNVADDNSHGMQCFSTVAANIPGQFIGKAPKASFHLFRTEETATEYPIEEFNWACGAERADSAGVEVISSSLGYGYEFDGAFADYPYSDLNGDITISAIAADLAAAKGILVFNSAGNSGNDYWHYITTPADADSIIAVGAVNSDGLVGAFSSYGPSADGRIKPDLASVGVAALVQTTANTVGMANGTSFAGPNLAGMSTCLWQGFPEFNNMQIIYALRSSGSLFNNPNDRIGYGIPDMKKAFQALLREFVTTSINRSGCQVQLQWKSKDMSAMKYEVERKSSADGNFVRIAEVTTQGGEVLGTHSYDFSTTVNDIPEGLLQYRIRQVLDSNATSFTAIYLDTLSINLDNPCITSTSVSARIAPTPTAGNATLLIETPEAVASLLVNVYDMKGSMVLQVKTSKSAGLLNVTLPTSSLGSGRYIVKIYDGTKSIAKTSIVKQ